MGETRMRDTVILSIRPEYAIGIFAGFKKYEFRKKAFSDNVRTVIVYVTMPVGMVLGEFHVDGIDFGSPLEIWAKCRHAAGISEKAFFEYYKGHEVAFAIRIQQAHQYLNPLKISDFCKRPPQSFYYLS